MSYLSLHFGDKKQTMRPIHLFGLLLWRGGLLLVGAFLLYEGARWLLMFVDLPEQLTVGLGLALAGVVMVFISLIIERIRDARLEGDLKE
jgi:hypothetical protein